MADSGVPGAGSLSSAITTKLLQFLMGRFHWKVPFVSAAHRRPRDDGALGVVHRGLFVCILHGSALAD